MYKHTCGSGLIVAIQIAALLPFTLLVQQQGKMTSSNASTVVHTAENSSVNLTEHPPSQISIQEQSEKDSSDENIGEASSPQEPGKSTDGIAKKPLVVATEHEDDEDDALSSLLLNASLTSVVTEASVANSTLTPHSPNSPNTPTSSKSSRKNPINQNSISISRSNGSRGNRTKKKNSLIGVQQSILKRTGSTMTLGDSIRSAGSINDSPIVGTVPAAAPPIRRVDSNVSFQSVNVREYDRTIGDNPSCSYGIPISLDWSHSGEVTHKLEDYENLKDMKKAKRPYNFLARIPASKRESLVKLNLGYSDEEIKMHMKETKKVQRSRSVTDLVSPYWRIHDACQSASRKLKRNIKKKKDKEKTPYEKAVDDAISRSSSHSSISGSINSCEVAASKETPLSHVKQPPARITKLLPKLLPKVSNLDRSSGSTESLGDADDSLFF